MDEPVTREQLLRALGGGSGNVARQVRENADEVLAVLQYAALHPKAPIPEAGVAPKEGGKESQQSSPLPPATPEKKRRKSPASVASAARRTRKAGSSVRDEPVVLNASRIEALDAGALPPHQPSGPTDVLSVDTVIGDDGKIAATVDGVRAALGVALTEVETTLGRVGRSPRVGVARNRSG
ncbi:hypothetical protein FOZ62_004287 [Perkinsus olseni]|uniref:Uncharacterized protein n=1 Tax=Perkinsus olseni TaxID=32597 RepID=A0A7J6TM53_PEROL|nr:hypothetical protein FOZ62_004287 [Perkinsus olseni]